VAGSCEVDSVRLTGKIELAGVTKLKCAVLFETGQIRNDLDDRTPIPFWWRDSLAIAAKFASLNPPPTTEGTSCPNPQ
jgi:hypothetical protein